MARRRIISSVDTSDRLANLVAGSLLVGLAALFGLVALLSGDDEEPAATDAGVVTVTPSPSPSPDRDVVAAPTTVPEEPPDGVTPLQPRGERTDQVSPGTEGSAPDTDGTDEVVPVPPPETEQVDPGTDDGTDEVIPLPPPETDQVDPDGDEVVPPPDDDTVAGQTTEPDADATSDPDGATAGDEPVVPPSGIDDADRVPTLVIGDEPTDVHTVLADVDGDAVPERVWAAIVRNQVQVRVQGYREGGQWATIDQVNGAVADDLVGLWVQDLTGDGRSDITTRQWVGTNGESVSLWAYTDDQLDAEAMTASGGCWDGTNTFGVVGALVHPGEVLAICDEDPLPPALWSTAVYRWQDGRWTFVERAGVYQGD